MPVWETVEKTGLYGPVPLDCSLVRDILDWTVENGLVLDLKMETDKKTGPFSLYKYGSVQSGLRKS